MKRFIIVVLFLTAQMMVGQNKFSELITLEGNRMEKAMMEGNYEVIVEYTYPEIVNILGGKEKAFQMISGGMEQMKSQGLEFKEIEIGSPGDLYNAGEELHCLVPQRLVLESNQGTVETESYLLAVSQDEGKTWYFLDTAQLTPDRVQGLFPNFNPNLTLPEKTQPKFTPSEP
ncbi:hypothetical protein SAMN05216480_102271 [Pustulibacterium marinum]|uniref:Uncharacterized protein n=1 Tax=Pustulibacterium marinum TaxID=1224947 RepID=A0A1I7FVA9_9FLAO|nr:hypothetical protein [Pustulibacterium marinum]SFU40154.1 hypothetical protein SAMN05216480_102271 [Pustulibacterium marinum]